MENKHKGEWSMVIFVTGLHHSGTTVLAKFVEACGAKPVGSDFRPTKSHPKGYKEASQLTQLAEKVLNDAGYSWYDVPSYRNISETNKIYNILYHSEYIKKIADLIYSDELFYVKDPRLVIFAKGIENYFGKYSNFVFFYTSRPLNHCINSLLKEYKTYLSDQKIIKCCEYYNKYQIHSCPDKSIHTVNSFVYFIKKLREQNRLSGDWVNCINYIFWLLIVDKRIKYDDLKIIKEMLEFTKDYKI